MKIYFDFSTILVIVTLLTLLIWLMDIWFFRAKRVQKVMLGRSEKALEGEKIEIPEPKIVEYSRSFFPVLLIVLILRCFIAEPFRIPTGSMKPTLLEGDFVLVNKFTYGIRLPVTGSKVYDLSQPKRGDIIVFRYPKDTSVNFIKRLVGLPGDRIKYENKILYINDKPMTQTFVQKSVDEQANGPTLPVMQFTESLNGIEHPIYQIKIRGYNVPEFVVPSDQYFVMGDNRDNSEDSRVWGFVPEELILGKAFFIWMSWDPIKKDMRWDRIGTRIG